MYNLRILRRAIKDIAGFPKEYARLIASILIACRKSLVPLARKD
jgi:hypothetical protein